MTHGCGSAEPRPIRSASRSSPPSPPAPASVCSSHAAVADGAGGGLRYERAVPAGTLTRWWFPEARRGRHDPPGRQGQAARRRRRRRVPRGDGARVHRPRLTPSSSAHDHRTALGMAAPTSPSSPWSICGWRTSAAWRWSRTSSSACPASARWCSPATARSPPRSRRSRSARSTTSPSRAEPEALEERFARGGRPDRGHLRQRRRALARHEREYIEYVLASTGGNISEAARRLGLHRQSLQRKLRKYPPRR
jgi:hypothetical protein